MREIKFRGKTKDTEKWVYGVPFYNEELGGTFIIDNAESSGGEIKWTGHQVFSKTVGQYTEIEDVFFKGSYFGDVVKYIDDAGNQQLGVISRYEDEWNGYIRAIGGDDEGNQDGELGHTTFEVIGNIHDNPELLCK